MKSLKRQQEVLFQWPMQAAPNFRDYHYYYQGNHFDNDTTGSGFPLDYNCGNWAYSGHIGNDFYLWPFPWEMLDSGYVEVIAAAEGVIVNKTDGCDDRDCADTCEYGRGNHMAIMHTDSIMSRYLHMKKGSLTSKGIGDPVASGEFLGIVGTSGLSDFPHLHFDVMKFWTDSLGEYSELYDPFWGSCNHTPATASMWASQKPYVEPAILKISTHWDIPVMANDCPPSAAFDQPKYNNNFNFGETIYAFTYYRHISENDSTQFIIYRPDDSVFDNWVWIYPDPDTLWTFAYDHSFIIDSTESPGTWTFQAVYKGQTYTHDFTIGRPTGIAEPSANSPEEFALYQNFPNPFNSTTSIRFDISTRSNVTLKVYNLLAQEVATLVEQDLAVGQYEVHWDAAGLPSGVYLYRLQVGSSTATKKLIFLQ